MLIEQAFMSLPEIMVGAGYARQDYEAGIVSALSLAILQELNGRNINKPISCMCAERKYLKEGRSLRADLHVNLRRTFSGTQALSDFGFRFSNWIEAKYFRKTKGTPPSTQNLGMLAADLLRLMMLPPSNETYKDRVGTDKSATGRYLLHVYRGEPFKHINPKRKARGTNDRQWPNELIKEGMQTIESLELDVETKTFLQHVGTNLKNASVQMDVTNFVLKPFASSNSSEDLTLVLSRIDAFQVSYADRFTELRPDRTIVDLEGYEYIRAEFARELKKTKGSEESDSNTIGDEEYLGGEDGTQ